MGRKPREERAAEIQDSIRQILYHDWNPIGFDGLLPEDEYDSYIAPVYRILAGSRTEAELIAFLRCPPISDDQLRRVAQQLLALNVKL